MFVVDKNVNNNWCMRNLDTGDEFDLTRLEEIEAFRKLVNDLEFKVSESRKRDEYLIKVIQRSM